MNNLFSALMTPLVHRPGDPHPPRRKEPKPIKVLSPEQLRRREKSKRRPNANLPHIVNPWGLAPVRCAVVGAIAAGKENAEIAASLNISSKTVETHIQRAKEAMGGVNRVRLGVLWDRFVRGDNYQDAA
jgi:DNA-binding CsgD family transcriptional regulator